LQTKITKGHRLEAVERYKRIATYVATFSVFGEERPPVKDTKSLADMSAGLREKHEKQSPDRTGPKGCPSRKLSSGFSSTKTLRRAKLADSTLGRHLSKSFLVADEDGAQNDGET
jgi:hypothetical protein